MTRVLILGYGNPLRSDDGLGWQVAVQLLRTTSVPEVAVLPCPQLTVELAEPISRAECVLFIGGVREGAPGEFRCREMEPVAGAASFTHELSPQLLLGIARDLYGAFPEAYLLSISGESFEAGKSLSAAVEARIPELEARVCELVAKALHPETAPLSR